MPAGARRRATSTGHAASGSGALIAPEPCLSSPHGVRVEHRLGRGGNGEVWRGHHLGLDRPVALKWLWRGGVGDLRREARMLADLDHPHVVGVHDLWVPAAAPEGLAGRPCLMMALAEAGDAAGVAGQLAWPDLAPLVGGALAGLGHVAARGHLHLDVKPANLLLAVHEGRVRACLSDFGLGRAHGGVGAAGAGSSPAAGTPRYRPPEADAASGLGPTTDLYSLGVTLWALLTGLAPPGDGPLPPVRHSGAGGPGVVTAPAGIDALIARATHRDPRQRHGSAWELWRALAALGGADLTAAVALGTISQARAARAGEGAAGSAVFDLSTRAVVAPLQTPVIADSEQVVAQVEPAPRVPQAVPATPPPEPRWTGLDVFAGAGLARARRPRIEGRAAERAALWSMLHRTAQGDGPVVCSLSGPPGVGTSRLCAWLVEQARLTGAVAVAVLEGAGPFSAAEGLGRVAAALDLPVERGDPRRLAAELSVRIRQPDAPPLLVVLDPPEGAPALLRWLGACFTVAAPRLMVVLTGPPEGGAAEAGPAEALRRHPRTEVLRLAPLAGAEVVALVRQRVAVASTVAEQVAERAAGLPGHALALIAHAAEAGLLVPGVAGLAPVDGRALRLPADLAAAWRARARAMLGRDAAAERLLAATALWGGALPPALRDALANRGVRLTEAQTDLLADRGLLRVGPDGLALQQRALGEALWLAQVARGRGADLAARLAEAAASVADAGLPTTAGHLARLWQLAGRPDRAIATLVARAPDAFEALDAPETAALARRLAAEAPSPAARATCLAVEARALYAVGQNDAALDRLAEIAPEALAAAPLVARLEVAQVRLLAALSAGQVQVAAGRVAELVALAAAVPDPALALEARSSAARVEIVAGRFNAAIEHLGDLDELVTAPPRLMARARLLVVEALMHRVSAGDLDLAATMGEAALAEADRLADGSLRAQALNNLGDVRARQSDLDGAAAYFERAIEAGGDRFPLAAYPHANCAHIDLRRGAFEAARQRCERALDRLGAAPPPRLQLLLGGILLHALAATHRPTAFDTCAEAIEAVLGITDVTFIEARLGAEGAAAAFLAAGDPLRAARSGAIAATLRAREGEH